VLSIAQRSCPLNGTKSFFAFSLRLSFSTAKLHCHGRGPPPFHRTRNGLQAGLIAHVGQLEDAVEVTMLKRCTSSVFRHAVIPNQPIHCYSNLCFEGCPRLLFYDNRGHLRHRNDNFKSSDFFVSTSNS
jgi:hypothetical protein